MNLKKIRRKYWISLLMSPLTLIPFVGGGTFFILCGALDKLFQAGFALFAGLGIGIGGLITNIILRGDKFVEKAKQEVAEEEEKKREDALNAFEEQLRRTRDTSDEEALRDLRALDKLFKTEFDWANSSSAQAASQLLSIVNSNFGQCIRTLQASLKLYNTISSSGLSRDIKASLVKKREEMIKRVQETVKNLTVVFEQMHELSAADDPSSELSKRADELSRQLDLMKRIDERTKALDRRISLGEHSETLPEDDWIKDMEF